MLGNEQDQSKKRYTERELHELLVPQEVDSEGDQTLQPVVVEVEDDRVKKVLVDGLKEGGKDAIKGFFAAVITGNPIVIITATAGGFVAGFTWVVGKELWNTYNSRREAKMDSGKETNNEK